MSVVILGGNECMEREYTNACRKYGCKANGEGIYERMSEIRMQGQGVLQALRGYEQQDRIAGSSHCIHTYYFPQNA